jgi:hypothetical protein
VVSFLRGPGGSFPERDAPREGLFNDQRALPRAAQHSTIKAMRRMARNVLWLISAALTFAQVRDVYYQDDFKPLNITPTFDRGYLVVYDRNHRVDVFGPDEALMASAAAKASGAEWVGIENGAVDSHGTLALAVQPVSEPYTDRGGIALFTLPKMEEPGARTHHRLRSSTARLAPGAWLRPMLRRARCWAPRATASCSC